MNIATDPVEGMYYATKHDGKNVKEELLWFIAYVGMPDDDVDDGEEIDVRAVSKDEARQVAKAALEADYTRGMEVKEVVLA